MSARNAHQSRPHHQFRTKKAPQHKTMNLHEFHNMESKQEQEEPEPYETQPLTAHDIANEIINLNNAATTNPEHSFSVSTVCVLSNLHTMSAMNGKRVRIIGPFNEQEQRYPVFVYDTKDIVLIKPGNLKLARMEQQSDNIECKSQQEQIAEIIELSKRSKHENMATRFANKLMKSNFNQLNTKLMDDFNKVLEGNCIYIPYFLCRPKELRLLQFLKQDIKLNDEEENSTEIQGMVDWSRHLKHENPSFSVTFNMILEYISTYFDMEIYATRLNYYRNGQDWKPYHHDSHAYCSNKKDKEDFTIGVSFGQERVLSFKHVKTGQIFNIPQRNGDCFAFNSIVNSKFQHAVLKGQKSDQERFSIIAWGKRRTLNERNSGVSERNKGSVFTQRQIF